jgi:alginate O-acetyltransferase complex protein AlgI
MNFNLGKKIYTAGLKNKFNVLILGVFLNLALLSYFKYANFFIENINYIFSYYNLQTIENLKIILPIGISFFTFTQIAYLIDSYYDRSKYYTFKNYLLFVTYFPHLVAGPIIHHKQVMPQFKDKETFTLNLKKITVGLIIFIIGLSKKVLIADTVGLYVDKFYQNIDINFNPDLFLSWVGSLSYTIQLYFDFSGYSDMAIGLSLLFGVFLPFNFNSPFKSLSIIDFWQRWHMSLTKFISQYLFNPLSLRLIRFSMGKTILIENIFSMVVPIFITFFLIGIWHGASWTFALYGIIHAIFMVINHIWKDRNFLLYIDRYYLIKKSYWLLTFSCVIFSFVMFRAENVSDSIIIYKGMVGLNGIDFIFPNIKLSIILVFCMLIILKTNSTYEIVNRFFDTKKLKNINYKNKINKEINLYSIIAGVLLTLCLLQLGTPSTFLYYQF